MSNLVVLQSVRNIRRIVNKAKNRRLMTEEILDVEVCLQTILLEAKPPKKPSWRECLSMVLGRKRD